ncbi:MAG: hypothetical protein KDD62_14805, partial [Bdellovibrionales bacterium]|nr:hypothetical protein [Bdellovibrionales bacterium]
MSARLKFILLSALCFMSTLWAEDSCVEAKRLVQKGISLGDSSESELNYYRQALGLCEKLSEAHYNFGLVKLRQGFPDEAIDAFNKAIALREKETKYLLGKAVALVERKDFGAAK